MNAANAAAESIELSFDRHRLDIDVVHRFLSTDAYWSPGIPRAVVERAIANSLCIGGYDGGDQVGFGRLVTDYATFAYLADVFVLPRVRGRGVGRRLVRRLLDHDGVQGLRRVMLFTADAHVLYATLGFSPLSRPERGMEILRPDIHRTLA